MWLKNQTIVERNFGHLVGKKLFIKSNTDGFRLNIMAQMFHDKIKVASTINQLKVSLEGVGF